MRFNKIAKCLLGVAPVVALPFTFTSCSVYRDMMSGYTPSYAKLAPRSLTPEDAANEFFTKCKTQKDFVLEENLWTHGRSAQDQDSGETEVTGLTYTSKFASYYIYFNYITVDADAHKISYKINTDIEEDMVYHYKTEEKEWTSTGESHYKVEWECKNLEFDAALYTEKIGDKERTSWLIKPKIYDSEKDIWTQTLQDDEVINFNARYIIEAYNHEGFQRYAYEASETAVMDKTRSFTTELTYLLNYFCCFYSYYLDDCVNP